MFKIVKYMAKERKDIVAVNCMKDESDNIFVQQEMKKRWRENTKQLLNIENEWDGNVEYGIVEGQRMHITNMEVQKATGKMKWEGKWANRTGW